MALSKSLGLKFINKQYPGGFMKIALLTLLVATLSAPTFAQDYGGSSTTSTGTTTSGTVGGTTSAGSMGDTGTTTRSPSSTTDTSMPSATTSGTTGGMVEDTTTTSQSSTTRTPSSSTTTTKRSTISTTGRCTSAEGREYGQGEAGYNECLRNSGTNMPSTTRPTTK